MWTVLGTLWLFFFGVFGVIAGAAAISAASQGAPDVAVILAIVSAILIGIAIAPFAIVYRASRQSEPGQFEVIVQEAASHPPCPQPKWTYANPNDITGVYASKPRFELGTIWRCDCGRRYKLVKHSTKGGRYARPAAWQYLGDAR